MHREDIHVHYADPCINIALDTLSKDKQALFFVNTKPSAEKLAEEISKKVKGVSLPELAKAALTALSSPTQQCKRLAAIVHKGIAFHHAGLTSKQRELIEEEFRKGTIKIICSTPTLAIGLDLPAFRAVIRDLKRYGGNWGMQDIPVLEYQQMAGRAGRPSFDAWGEAITIAKTEEEQEEIRMRYIRAPPENIYSKLAVEPVLRTYLLSLISSGYVKTYDEILSFFSKTFWAHQYRDMHKLESILHRMLELLQEWEFIISSESAEEAFVSASELRNERTATYRATRLGVRVAELYLDPYTAHQLITAMHASVKKDVVLFSILHMIANTLEMRPLLRVKSREHDIIQAALMTYEDHLLFVEPNAFDVEYNEFLGSIKTALFLQEWCDEMDEQYLLEKYAIRPGEIKAKLDISDWLLYSCIELSKILSLHELQKYLTKVRVRVQHGVKEEVIPLLQLKGIGRVRARKLFKAHMRTIGDVKKCDIASLKQLLGPGIAASIKKQLGQEIQEEISPRKRTGQMGLGKYG